MENTKSLNPIFVFSMLHSESEEILKLCINNFEIFSDKDDYLIINTTAEINPSSYSEFNRVRIINANKRRAHGDSLLKGHIENWHVANNLIKIQNGDFLFLCMASNSLIFRNYDKLSVVNSMSIQGASHISNCTGWQYDQIRNNEYFLEHFGTHYAHNQIEGFAAWGKSWSLIDLALSNFDYNKCGFNNDICLEEVVPLSILTLNGHSSTNVSRVKWTESKQGDRFVNVHEIYVASKNLPDHIFMYKWFRRDSNAISTRSVCDQKLNKLLSGVYGLNYDDGFGFVAKIEIARGFLNGIKFPNTTLDYGHYYYDQTVDASFSRLSHRLNDSLTTSPYLYYESLPDDFDAKLSVAISGGDVSISSFSHSSVARPNSYDYFDLKFYAVLYLPIEGNVNDIFFTDFFYFRNDDGGHPLKNEFCNDEMLLNYCLLEEDGTYRFIYSDASSFASKLLKPFSYYKLGPHQSSRFRSVGIPIIQNINFSFKIRVGK